jgi:predicted NUDIX family NTP pyrophosphohydrolase
LAGEVQNGKLGYISMTKKRSSGILLYRFQSHGIEFFLVHPGGPFWAKKDAGAWSIPKGEFDESEDAIEAARREFHEETGLTVDGDLRALTPLKQPSGKLVYAWALEGDCDAAAITSNTFSMEWPPKSGVSQDFPEVDRAAWFDVSAAREKLLPGQLGFIDEVLAMLGVADTPSAKASTGNESPQGSLF